jgi:hypothetical protein
METSHTDCQCIQNLMPTLMDNDLVLNIAVDTASSNRVAGLQKGGRWIDRFLFIHYLFYYLFTSSIQAQSEAVSQEKS